MRRQNLKLSKESILLYNNSSRQQVRDYIKYGECLETDPEKELRLSKCLCSLCFYKPKGFTLAMHAFTTVNCSICDEAMTFTSSIVDRLCEKCSELANLCKKCSSSLNYDDSEISLEEAETQIKSLKDREECLEALTTLSTFEFNWNGHNALPADRNALIYARDLINAISSKQLYPTTISLDEGNVVLTWRLQDEGVAEEAD